jgi:hypothetical protein
MMLSDADVDAPKRFIELDRVSARSLLHDADEVSLELSYRAAFPCRGTQGDQQQDRAKVTIPSILPGGTRFNRIENQTAYPMPS